MKGWSPNYKTRSFLGVLGVVVGLATCLVASQRAYAWERHDLITRSLLRKSAWLSAYRTLMVTQASGSDCPQCDKSPYNPDYIPLFLDRLPGETTSAREVLVRYVDEPDWGMDEGLELSPLQGLAGGSKGFRHQLFYYASGIIRVGDGPNRVGHFYDLAVKAIAAGDRYWAFRQLSRALHYLEDMGQPLHTRPILYRWLGKTRLDPGKTTTLATNFHFGYERFVTWHLSHEIRASRGPLLAALREPPKMVFSDAKTAAWALAEHNSNRGVELLAVLDAFWSKRIKSFSKMVLPTESEINPARRSELFEKLMDSTRRSLELTAGAVLSVLELARRDFAAAERGRREGM